MTEDRGLSALAAALHAIHPGPRPWVGGLTDDEFAAAILGERGVFLPDGMPVPLGNLTEEEIVAAFKSGYLVPRPPAEQAATIATLRAAMDGLVEPLGEWLIEMMERNLTPAEATLYDALRAALATTKEAGGG